MITVESRHIDIAGLIFSVASFYSLSTALKARGTFHLAAVVAARRVEVCGVYDVFRMH